MPKGDVLLDWGLWGVLPYISLHRHFLDVDK